MNRIISVLAGVATISMFLITLWDHGVFTSQIYESEIEGTIKGQFGEEIIIRYIDGSIDSLKNLEERIVMNIFYDNRPISNITYQLSLKVDFDSEIDNSNYECVISIGPYNTTKTYNDVIVGNANEWVTVASVVIDMFDEIPTGLHTLFFCNSGYIKIRSSDAWTEICPPVACKGIEIIVSDAGIVLE